MAAALDVLGYLPGPPTRYNCGAAETLAGETFAYGVGASVAVLDVRPRTRDPHAPYRVPNRPLSRGNDVTSGTAEWGAATLYSNEV